MQTGITQTLESKDIELLRENISELHEDIRLLQHILLDVGIGESKAEDQKELDEIEQIIGEL